jgi:hypothetical protein
MLCASEEEANYPRMCVEDGCPGTVVAYRIWDACYYDKPAEEAFPLDLGCTDILDESLATDYFAIACCCEEYESMESES